MRFSVKINSVSVHLTMPPHGIQAAENALAISPICPEAYNVLAINQADNFDEALEMYRKAAQLGPQVR